jgi:branched-chain amino acid transport system permease protein
MSSHDTSNRDVGTMIGDERHIFGFTRERFYLFVAFAAFIVVSPLFLYPIFLLKVYCFIIFALAYNLLLGYTGLMSFGHAAFFGMAGYSCGWVATTWGLPTGLSVIAGTIVAALIGLVFGWIAIKRTGLYFAMITLALAQMVYFICLQAPFTGGEDGLQGVPRGTLFGVINLKNDTILYWTVAVITLLTLAGVNRVVHSPFGQVLRAIRNNPERTKSLGYNVDRYKLISFTLSAALTGFAASLKTVIFGIATLTDVSTVVSTEAVLIVLVGGIGTMFGPVVGAYLVLSLEHFMSPFGPWVMFTQGVVFMLFVLVFRQGIVGELQKKLKIHL